MKVVRWGIIGCGNVTEIKSGPAFQNVPGSKLVAVMRRNGKLAEDFARRHQVPCWYDDAQALIDDPDVDAVYIATPPDSHKDYCLLAAQAGKPVYVEKPMARNALECQLMIDACKLAGVPLFVAYYRRALPRFLKIKEILQNGAIGIPRAVTTILMKKPFPQDLTGAGHWRIIPEIAGCGYFCDLAPHTLDILQFFLGAIEYADGFTANRGGLYKAEDSVSAILRFENNLLGTGFWSFTAQEELDRTEIFGTEGRLVFSTFGQNPIILENAGGKKSILIKNPKHIQQPLIETIVNALNGIGHCPSTGETAIHTNRVMDAILGRAASD